MPGSILARRDRVCLNNGFDLRLLSALEEAFRRTEAMEVHLLSRGLYYYPSDHRRFRFHTAIAACRYLGGLGYYIPRLRTGRDTILDIENIDCITEGIVRFLPLYFTDEK